MNSVPTFIEKTYQHPNGTTFKVLHCLASPASKKFIIEYPSDIDISANRLILSQIKAGLTPSYTYRLEITGGAAGYRAWKEGSFLYLNLGKAVPHKIEIPAEIKVEIKKNGLELEITGAWKNDVSLLAGEIRGLKPSHKDRYKQKGIKYITADIAS